MIRKRFSTLVTTMSLVLSLSAATALLPATALGALANVQIGGGVTVDEYPRAATPTQVSPGNVAGFYLWVKNEDAANLSTFFMKAMSSASPIGAYFSKNGGENTNCPIVSGKLNCTFGTLNAGDVLKIVAAFRIDAAPGTANCKPTDSVPPAPADPGQGYFADQSLSPVCVDFRFTSNSGNVPGKNKSRGDDYHWYDFVATNVTGDDGAGFPFCNQTVLTDPPCATYTPLLTVYNALHAGRNDVQTTQVTAPPGAFNSAHGSTGLGVHDNFPFSCTDTTGLTGCTNHEGSGSSAFVGQWSQVDVNSEQSFLGDADGELIRIDLQMYGVNANSIDGVYHIWQDDFVPYSWHEETISTRCLDEAGLDPPAPCFWASGNGNVATVTIWSYNNGNYRNF